MPSLREVQHWLLSVMTTPGGAEHGVALAGRRTGFGADALVRSDEVAGVMRRLGVYADGYLLRLHDCLAADYPILRRVMENEVFGFFAHAYLWENPSRSPTLYDLGAGFPAFLARHRPPQADMTDGNWLLPVELARFERAWLEAMRDHGPEQAPSQAVDASPWDALQAPHWTVPPCVRLLDLRLPLIPFWQAIARGDAVPAVPQSELCFVVIARMHYRVSAHTLTRWQFGMLNALREGYSAAQASRQVAGHELSPERVLADWALWAPVAQQLGLVKTASLSTL
jgi:hypothetical protein